MLTSESMTGTDAQGPLAGPLRMLMIAYQIWGRHNECAADELSDMYRMTTPALLAGMRRLAADGLVCIDDRRRTLSLTEAGARALSLMPAALDS